MDPPLYAVVAVDLSARQRASQLARVAARAHEGTVDLTDEPLLHAYHYSIPSELVEQLVPGQLVWVPFGREQRQGVLLGFSDQSPVPSLRPLLGIAQIEPFLQPHQIALARWLSHRYLAPIWDTLLLMLPPGVMQRTERRVRRSSEPVRNPLTRDTRTLLAWLESGAGESSLAEIAELLGSERATRDAVAEGLREGLLREIVAVRPPGVRPRVERFARLASDADAREVAFRTLGRRSSLADALDLLRDAGGEMPLHELEEKLAGDLTPLRRPEARDHLVLDWGRYVRLVGSEASRTSSAPQRAALEWLGAQGGDVSYDAALAAGHRAQTLSALERQGMVAIEQRYTGVARALLPPTQARIAADALRGAARYRLALDMLDRAGGELPTREITQATGITGAQLERMAAAGLIELEEREVLRNPLASRRIEPTDPPLPTPEQEAVWDELRRAIALPDVPGRASRVFLLHGVTGSGKTEIYLRAVAETLARGRQAIVLVPEISLTPQTVARFGSRFGELIALQHSQLSEGERYDEWRRLRDGRAQVAIGSRSALFAPLPDPGLIVIDEEHEGSYKQGFLPGYRFPQYHTRDAAVRLAAQTGATVILGSATPSVESYHRAERGHFRLLEMGQRVVTARSETVGSNGVADLQSLDRAVPVQVVDMRQELRVGNTSIFSRELQRAIAVTLGAGQQAILFLNRRGEHAFVMCRDCGWVRQCDNCDVPMTHHRGHRYLICHQCSATAPIPTVCAECMSPRVKRFGVGTQQVENVAQSLFPSARLLRWDRDTARGRGAHARLLARFAAGEADILIGTQMIAKGLDLPLVTLVGVISADTALHLPDFRSGERTFQLLTQVAGRAGRSELGGRVILQTYTPLHYAIRAASRHHYHEFYEHEIAFRREHAYPPFAPLVRLVVRDPAEAVAEGRAHELAARLRDRLARDGLAGTEVIGPAPAFFARLRGRYRWQIVVRGADARDLVRATMPGLGWEVDVDPISML